MIMWNWLAGILAALILMPLLLALLSWFQEPVTGLADGRLKACPNSPNCIQSEENGHPSYAPPIPYSTPAESAWHEAEITIREMGGTIVGEDNGYLHATFASPLFRFIDDLELRQDRENGFIHFRSSSRIGYSDLGANRKRVEEFRQRMTRPDE